MLPVVVSLGSGGSPEFKPPCFTRSTLVSPDDQDGPSFLCGAVPEPLVYSLVLATPCPRGGSSASAHTGFFAAILLFFLTSGQQQKPDCARCRRRLPLRNSGREREGTHPVKS